MSTVQGERDHGCLKLLKSSHYMDYNNSLKSLPILQFSAATSCLHVNDMTQLAKYSKTISLHTLTDSPYLRYYAFYNINH